MSILANSLPTRLSIVVSFTHKLEFSNSSLPTLLSCCRVKAAELVSVLANFFPACCCVVPTNQLFFVVSRPKTGDFVDFGPNYPEISGSQLNPFTEHCF